jgi:hypothetical protein
MLIFARFPSPRRASVEHAGKRSAKSVSLELEMSQPSVNRQLQQEKDEEEKQQQQQQQVSDALKSNYPNIPEIS